MGPLSAVAVVFWLAFYGLAGVGLIMASATTLGIFALIAAGVILLDVFVIGRFWNRG